MVKKVPQNVTPTRFSEWSNYALRETLPLPGRKTISSYFGKLGDPGAIEECKSMIIRVFSTLTELETYVSFKWMKFT